MSYITLAGACLLFSFQFLFYKLYQLRTDSNIAYALWMTVFNGVWLFILFFSLSGFSFHITPLSSLYVLAFVFFIMSCDIVTLFTMRTGKIAMISVFMLTGGLFLPVIYGVTLLGEKLTTQKAIGLSLTLIAILLIVMQKKDASGKNLLSLNIRFRNWLLYFTIFICNGMISIITKAYSTNIQSTTYTDFLILTALVRLLAGLLLIAGLSIYNKSRGRSSVLLDATTKNIDFKRFALLFLVVGGFSICNGVANIFSLSTAKVMDASQQFPILSAAVILITTFISWIVYKEKPSKEAVISIFLTLGGIVIMVV